MKSSNHINCTGLYKIFKVSDLEVVALRGVDLIVEYGELFIQDRKSKQSFDNLFNIIPENKKKVF